MTWVATEGQKWDGRLSLVFCSQAGSLTQAFRSTHCPVRSETSRHSEETCKAAITRQCWHSFSELWAVTQTSEEPGGILKEILVKKISVSTQLTTGRKMGQFLPDHTQQEVQPSQRLCKVTRTAAALRDLGPPNAWGKGRCLPELT